MKNTSIPADLLPSKILYSMQRVSNLDQSIEFYRDMLGMKELRRETFPKGQFTLVFMGYGESSGESAVELTYNWGEDSSYEMGTGYGHIAVGVNDIYRLEKALQEQGVEVIRRAGPMTFAPTETGEKEVIAFIRDPDGYKVELIQAH